MNANDREKVIEAIDQIVGLAYELWAKIPLENGYQGESITRMELQDTPGTLDVLPMMRDALGIGESPMALTS